MEAEGQQEGGRRQAGGGRLEWRLIVFLGHFSSIRSFLQKLQGGLIFDKQVGYFCGPEKTSLVDRNSDRLVFILLKNIFTIFFFSRALA
jgi:hypothetical protein